MSLSVSGLQWGIEAHQQVTHRPVCHRRTTGWWQRLAGHIRDSCNPWRRRPLPRGRTASRCSHLGKTPAEGQSRVRPFVGPLVQRRRDTMWVSLTVVRVDDLEVFDRGLSDTAVEVKHIRLRLFVPARGFIHQGDKFVCVATSVSGQ